MCDAIEDSGLKDTQPVNRRRGKSGRLRTAAQQQQNKLAQQRYRERRKQKVHELERRVDELLAQLDAAVAGRASKCMSSEETSSLRKQAIEQQRLIDHLRNELQSFAVAVEKTRPAVPESRERAPAAGKPPEQLDSNEWMRSLTPEEALAHIIKLADCIQTALASSGLQDLPSDPATTPALGHAAL